MLQLSFVLLLSVSDAYVIGNPNRKITTNPISHNNKVVGGGLAPVPCGSRQLFDPNEEGMLSGTNNLMERLRHGSEYADVKEKEAEKDTAKNMVEEAATFQAGGQEKLKVGVKASVKASQEENSMIEKESRIQDDEDAKLEAMLKAWEELRREETRLEQKAKEETTIKVEKDANAKVTPIKENKNEMKEVESRYREELRMKEELSLQESIAPTEKRKNASTQPVDASDIILEWDNETEDNEGIAVVTYPPITAGTKAYHNPKRSQSADTMKKKETVESESVSRSEPYFLAATENWYDNPKSNDLFLTAMHVEQHQRALLNKASARNVNRPFSPFQVHMKTNSSSKKRNDSDWFDKPKYLREMDTEQNVESDQLVVRSSIKKRIATATTRKADFVAKTRNYDPWFDTPKYVRDRHMELQEQYISEKLARREPSFIQEETITRDTTFVSSGWEQDNWYDNPKSTNQF